MFSKQLKELMEAKGVSQAALSRSTGINKGSISQYLSGIHEPNDKRKRQIAVALGEDENFFQHSEVRQSTSVKGNNMSPRTAARLMGKSLRFVYQGLQDGIFPWGYGVKLDSEWSYYISPVMFSRYTGIEV